MTHAASALTLPCPSGRIATLVDLIGLSDLPLELARLLNQSFAADHIFMVKAGRYEQDLIQAATFDGSNGAIRLKQVFFERRLDRFERDLVTRADDGSADIAVASDHTQEFASPEFRSFGREMGIGARYLIRRSEAHGSVAIAVLWSMSRGDVSHIYPHLREAAELIAPIVAKHMTICDERTTLPKRISSVSSVETALRHCLNNGRRREVQVGARIIAGMSTNDIADDLMISRETVISHRRSLYGRLGLLTSRDLLIWYLAHHG